MISRRLHNDMFDERFDPRRFLILARCRARTIQPEMGDFVGEEAQIHALEHNLLRSKGQHKPFVAVHRPTTAVQKMVPRQQPALAVRRLNEERRNLLASRETGIP